MKPTRRVQRGFRIHPDWANALGNVQIVLVETTHPGNIGAVARVMKNMGLTKLELVSSTGCGPETDALPLASGAYDLVAKAGSFDHLTEALANSVMAVATSARLGGKRTTARTPTEIAPEIMTAAKSGEVSIVFGRESRGLTNEEIKLCDQHMIIPTDADFASMNLAQAVAVICYELFKIASQPVGFQALSFHPAPIESRELMYKHIEQSLARVGFLPRKNPLRMMRDVRRILNSASIDERDVRIIRGMVRKVDNAIRLAGFNRHNEARDE
ncbi:MAG: RNA methyltransferase [Deltaproteobacteria bacterium]|nr:RNA methyltransferase [Deltaproteobacteria bacterium]